MKISSHDGIVISDYPLNILRIELNINTKLANIVHLKGYLNKDGHIPFIALAMNACIY